MQKKSTFKVILGGIAFLIALFLVWGLVKFLAVLAFKIVVAALIVGGGGYLIYRAVMKPSKSLPGRDRTPLP